MNRLSASAIVIALAASIASCSLTRPTPVKQMFLIEAPAPAAAVTPQSPLAARIGTVTVAAPYRDRAGMRWQHGEPSLEDVFIELMTRATDNFQ